MYNCYCLIMALNGQFQRQASAAWTTYTSGPMAAYLSSVAPDTSAILAAILGDTNLSNFTSPMTIYIGYGTSSDEMIAAGRYNAVFSQ